MNAARLSYTGVCEVGGSENVGLIGGTQGGEGDEGCGRLLPLVVTLGGLLRS